MLEQIFEYIVHALLNLDLNILEQFDAVVYLIHFYFYIHHDLELGISHHFQLKQNFIFLNLCQHQVNRTITPTE